MKKIAIALCLAFACLAVGQVPDTTPPDELKKLEWMLGEWSGQTKWTMEGMEADMATTMKVEREGQFIKLVSVMEMAGFKMDETMYIGWDPEKKRYDAWAFTNFAPTPRLEHGNFEGDVLVMVSEPWTVGSEAPIIGRAKVTRASAREMHLTVEFKMGETWEKVAEATYTRKQTW